MPFDRDALRRAADAADQRIRERAPTGVAGMLAGLHKGALAGFVTVESVALPPVPAVRDGRWTVVALLATSAGPGGPGKGLQPPWGAVTWSAGGEVADTARFEAPAATGPYVWRPDRTAWGTLLAALDRVIAGPTDADLAPLAALYRGLLPEEVVPVVHSAVPATRGWLG